MGRERIERIRDRAHAIWEREGRPEGRDVEHWQAASAEIDAEDAGAPPAANSGSESPKPKRRASRQTADESAPSHTEGILSGATKRAAGAARRAVGAAKRTAAAIAGTDQRASGSGKTPAQTGSRGAADAGAPAAAKSAASGAPGQTPSRLKSAGKGPDAKPARSTSPRGSRPNKKANRASSGREREAYTGNRILVIGGGHSAINVVLDLLRLQESAPELALRPRDRLRLGSCRGKLRRA